MAHFTQVMFLFIKINKKIHVLETLFSKGAGVNLKVY